MVAVVVREYRKWSETGKMSQELANMVHRDLEGLFKSELPEIDRLAQSDPPEAAARMMLLLNYVNSAAQKAPSIIAKLGALLGQVRSSLAKIWKQARGERIQR